MYIGFHHNRFFRAGTHTKTASVAKRLIISDLIIIPKTCAKSATINARTAMGAPVAVCISNEIRMRNQVFTPVFHEKLQVVAAARAAIAQSEYLAIRTIKTHVDQPAFIGQRQDISGFLQSELARLSLCHELFSNIVQEKACLPRMVTAVIMTAAFTICNSKGMRVFQQFNGLYIGDNPLFYLDRFGHGYDL